jgi:hypothetical protein
LAIDQAILEMLAKLSGYSVEQVEEFRKNGRI